MVSRTAGELSLISGSVTHCDFYVTNWLLEIVQALVCVCWLSDSIYEPDLVWISQVID